MRDTLKNIKKRKQKSMPNYEYIEEVERLPKHEEKKIMSIQTEEDLTSLFIKKLKEKGCTLSNFEEISENVQLYFKNNATCI